MKKFILNYLGINQLKEDLSVMLLVSEIRNKKHFIQSYTNDESVIRYEKESPEQYYERCYNIAFDKHILEEKEVIKNLIEINNPQKSVSEIKRILDLFY